MNPHPAFSGQDFLRVAETLESDLREAEKRTAIGRAYYANFLYARTFLESKRVPISAGGEAHADVRRAIGEWDLSVSGLLGRLHALRKKADYLVPFDGQIDTDLKLAMTFARKAKRCIDFLFEHYP